MSTEPPDEHDGHDDDPAGELLELTRAVRDQVRWLERGAARGYPGALQARVIEKPRPKAAAAVAAPVARAVPAPAPGPAPAGPAPITTRASVTMTTFGAEGLALIRDELGDCTRCKLSGGRKQIVYGVGNPNAKLMFVGEAPGADEDAKGEPFVGRAGQLLNKIIEAIGMKREDVFIGNINRCRPPGNRTPTLPEAHTCRPFLLREIAVVRPKIIVVMGNTACQNLLDTKVGISKIRGTFQDYFGVKVMPTFHPAYLLRDPSKKRETWEDMKKVREELNKLKG